MFFSLARAPIKMTIFCTALLLASAAFLGSCSKAPTGPPPGVAVVRFENLSGDPSLEWLGRAASEVLSGSLAGAVEGTLISGAAVTRIETTHGSRPGNAPGISAQRSAAILAGARLIIAGYFYKTPGGVRFEATEEDSATGKALRTLSVSGPPSIETLTQLARAFSASAHPYLTKNNEALRLYAFAVEQGTAEAETKLREAVVADPAFGPAWIALSRLVAARGNPNESARVVEQALLQKMDKLSTANLKLDYANMTGGELERLAALRELIEASPGDTALLRQLAQARSATGQFGEAANLWEKLAAALPDDADAWNQLGYTRAWAGDYNSAVRAMGEYRRIRATDPNSDDSTGDIYLMFRHYPEAAASYLASVAKEPFFQNGTSLYKAAWTKFLMGDLGAADKLFTQYRAAHEKQGTPNLSLLEGEWLHLTGRDKEATALIRKEVLKLTSLDSQGAYYQTLAVWDLLAKDRETAASDAKAAGGARTPLAAVVQFAVLPSASAAEWTARADKMLPGAALANLRNLAVGYALVLDGKRAEALPFWDKIIATTPAGDFALRALHTRLKGEKPALEVVPNPGVVNPLGAIGRKL